jgi:molybdenum cofactor synthesis domain-containing protein
VSARAGIVVTGTEVLTGRVQDRNGPWIAARLLELGVELAHITICGDRPDDIAAQLRFLADEGVDLIVTSGGLGPTADDMTVAVVSQFCGRELVRDTELEEKIAAIIKRLQARFTDMDFDAVRAANRIDDPVPAGATILGTGLGGQPQRLAADERRTGWAWPAFEERRFEAFRAYYRFVPKGRFTTEYTLRLNNPGTFQLPSTRVDGMYAPETFGERPNAPLEVLAP